jgi:YhcH/YjgK/YiaL family protein
MIFAKLNTPSTYTPLIGHPVWDQALTFLHKLNEQSPLGITELRGDKMFVNVHTYLTKIDEDCRFEGHRNMIDLQYIIKGGEIIDWHLKENLVADGAYDEEKDFQFYKCPSKLSGTRISLQAGHFGIFFPEDGHRPQINDGKNDSVLKAVVKIHRELLS